MQPNERLGIALSVVTVALFIIALILFISYGGNAAFYATVIAALLIGFFNAWMISHEGRMRSAPAPKRKRMRKRSRR